MSAKTNNHPGRRTPLSLSGGNPNAVGGNSTMRQQQINFTKQQQAAANGNATNGKTEKTHHKDNALSSPHSKDRHKDLKKPHEQPQAEQQQQQQPPQQQKPNEEAKTGKSKQTAKTVEQSVETKKEHRGTRAAKKTDKEAIPEEKQQQKPAAPIVSSPPPSSLAEKSNTAANEATPTKCEPASESISGKGKTPTPTKAEKKNAGDQNEVIVEDTAAKAVDVTPTKSVAEPKVLTTPKKKDVAAVEKDTVALTTPEKTDNTNAVQTTPTSSVPSVNTTPLKTETTTAIDDMEMMEPLTVEASPIKANNRPEEDIKPAATSTPGRALFVRNAAAGAGASNAKSDVQLAMETAGNISPPARSFSAISGRRSFRPNNEFTPLRMHSQLQSYRTINTELDVSSVTNTSLNVTVGSERPSNLSFSFSLFGGRKRERTADEEQRAAEMITSPPKRARTERNSFLSFMASPLTRLRNSFARTSIHGASSLANELDDARNVSGVAIEEEIPSVGADNDSDTTMGAESSHNLSAAKGDDNANLEEEENIVADIEKPDSVEKSNKKENKSNVGDGDVGVEAVAADDIEIVETPIAAENPSSKHKNCCIM